MAERCSIDGKRKITISGWKSLSGRDAAVDPATGTMFELVPGSSGSLSAVDSAGNPLPNGEVYYVSADVAGGTSTVIASADADLGEGFERVESPIEFEDTLAKAATPNMVIGAEELK